MSCFADWSKRCHLAFIIVECWTCRATAIVLAILQILHGHVTLRYLQYRVTFSTLVHHIWMSHSLPCIICIMLLFKILAVDDTRSLSEMWVAAVKQKWQNFLEMVFGGLFVHLCVCACRVGGFPPACHRFLVWLCFDYSMHSYHSVV